MPKSIPGVIRGKTITLDAEPVLADGQRVAVTVRPVIDPEERHRRLADLAGVLADRPDADWEALDLLVHERS
jgi:hypothetical protein